MLEELEEDNIIDQDIIVKVQNYQEKDHIVWKINKKEEILKEFI